MTKFDDVFIANYSGIMACYDLLLNPDIDHEQKKLLIVQPFWLDGVDDSRLDSTWGQNVAEFPVHISNVLKSLFPDIENQERVTFRQVKALRAECIARLQRSEEYEVVIGDFNQIQTVADEKTDKLFLSDLNSNTLEYTLNKEAKFFNFSQKHVSDGALTHLPSQTEVYKYPKGQEPKHAIVLGAGLSAVWFLEQTQGTTDTKICVRNEGSRPPPSIARNQGKTITIDDCFKLNKSELLSFQDLLNKKNSLSYNYDAKIRSMTDSKIAFARSYGFNEEDEVDNQVTLVIDKQTGTPQAIGHAYVAYGYKTDDTLINIDNKNKIHLPDEQQKEKNANFYAPKNIPGDAGFARYVYLKQAFLGNSFKAINIDIEALVLTENEKPLLAQAFNAPIDFIDDLCNNIRTLEDTPADPLNYIKEHWSNWINRSLPVTTYTPKFDEFFKARREFNQSISPAVQETPDKTLSVPPISDASLKEAEQPQVATIQATPTNTVVEHKIGLFHHYKSTMSVINSRFQIAHEESKLNDVINISTAFKL